MNFAAARFNMIECQIRTNRVSDPAISAALAAVPRDGFLPQGLAGRAYVDEDVAIGGGRYLLEPLVLARLVKAADVRPADVALVVGDPTGWASAVVARLASTVVALDCQPEIVARVGVAVAGQGCDNVASVLAPLDAGFPAQAPYDVIIYAGAVADIPDSVQRQLTDGGRLAAVVRKATGVGQVVQLVRAGDSFGRRVLFDVATPYLPGMEPKPGFTL